MYRNRRHATFALLSLVLAGLVGACVPFVPLLNPLNPGGGSPSGGGGGGGGGGGYVNNGGGGIPGGSSGCLGLGNPSDATHQGVVDQLNLYRLGSGLQALQYSTTLQLAADRHAQDMYTRHFFDHTNPDGLGPGDRAVAAGFCHRYGGENIAQGQNMVSTVGEVMNGWKNSPGHNANMLNGQYRYVGVGYFHIRDGVNDFYYWVQLFAVDI